MEQTQVTVEGTLQPDGTLVLDEKPALPPGRVRVRVEAAPRPVQTAEEFRALLRRIRGDEQPTDDGCSPGNERIEMIRRMREEAEERLRRLEQARKGQELGAC